MLFSLAGITETNRRIFSLEQTEFEPAINGFYLGSEIIFHLNKDLHLVKRSVFTFWNALGEIGGLFGVIYGSFAILIQFANY